MALIAPIQVFAERPCVLVTKRRPIYYIRSHRHLYFIVFFLFFFYDSAFRRSVLVHHVRRSWRSMATPSQVGRARASRHRVTTTFRREGRSVAGACDRAGRSTRLCLRWRSKYSPTRKGMVAPGAGGVSLLMLWLMQWLAYPLLVVLHTRGLWISPRSLDTTPSVASLEDQSQPPRVETPRLYRVAARAAERNNSAQNRFKSQVGSGGSLRLRGCANQHGQCLVSMEGRWVQMMVFRIGVSVCIASH